MLYYDNHACSKIGKHGYQTYSIALVWVKNSNLLVIFNYG